MEPQPKVCNLESQSCKVRFEITGVDICGRSMGEQRGLRADWEGRSGECSKPTECSSQNSTQPTLTQRKSRPGIYNQHRLFPYPVAQFVLLFVVHLVNGVFSVVFISSCPVHFLVACSLAWSSAFRWNCFHGDLHVGRSCCVLLRPVLLDFFVAFSSALSHLETSMWFGTNLDILIYKMGIALHSSRGYMWEYIKKLIIY